MKRSVGMAVCILSAACLLVGCGESPDTPQEVENKNLEITCGFYDDEHQPVYSKTYGSYSGTVVNGIPNGMGRFVLEDEEGNGYSYEGEFVEGKANGQGALVSSIDDVYYCEKGTFTEGLYTPTKAEMMASYGEFSEWIGTFNISDAGMEFISAHEEIFPTTSEKEAEGFMNPDAELRKLKKTTDGFDNSLIRLKDTYVLQTSEDFYGGHTITQLLLSDSDFNCVNLYYLGKIDYYEGDTINTIYALPLDNTGFENVSGGTTLCVAALGSYIS